MYQHKLEKDLRCPLEYGLSVFGGKWKSRVICVLARQEALRYSSIRNEMGNITDAVLASTLKELMKDGLLIRKQFEEIPPHVEYSLSEKGHSVVPILQAICQWSEAYYEDGKKAAPQCRNCTFTDPSAHSGNENKK